MRITGLVKKTGLKYIGDITLNIIASSTLVAVLQLLIYPSFAKYYSAGAYGTFLTAIGIFNMVAQSLGNSLNNLRLIQNAAYAQQKLRGDYNLLCLSSSMTGAVLIGSISFLVLRYSFFASLLLAMASGLSIARFYYVVDYRLSLNYKKILFCNIAICIGYIIGLLGTKSTKLWQLVFLCGEAGGCLYLCCTTTLPYEPFVKTPNFSATTRKFIVLLAVSLMGSGLLYVDRLLIYPILGAERVSFYTVAAFFGKCLGMVLNPISSVLLSYFSQEGFLISKKKYLLILASTVAVAICFAIVSTAISPWFTGLLYPTLIESAKPYLWIANLAAIVGAAATLIRPVVLKFCNLSWQVAVQVIDLSLYICLGIWLMQLYGLTGFCCAALISNAAKFLILAIAGFRYVNRQAVLHSQ